MSQRDSNAAEFPSELKSTHPATATARKSDGKPPPFQAAACGRTSATIEAVFEEKLAAFPVRCRYDRNHDKPTGYRHGHRERQLFGTFGAETVSVPRARAVDEAGKTAEWRSKTLPRYQQLMKKAEAIIAPIYLSGTNTRG